MLESIFISSSGDLASLRQRLNDDLYPWLDQHGFAHLLKPYLWEEDKEGGRLLSDRQRIQDQLPDPASLDVPLTICLFGERCGSPLEDELNPLVIRRFDAWRAKDDGPGLLHPWPKDRMAQEAALESGKYPLTGTVYELLSAHSHPEKADNLIVAYCADRPIVDETSADNIALNGRKLFARLTAGRSEKEMREIEAGVCNPQVRALLNLLKDYGRRVRFVRHFADEETMREEVFETALAKLRDRLGIASRHNPFKQSLAHWTVDDDKPLPGRGETITKIVGAMEKSCALVLLKGRSGCGKSSLMQSGVMKRLQDRYGTIPVPFRPTELMATADEGDALERLASLIARTADLPFPGGGVAAMRPKNYASRLRESLERNRVRLLIGLDQFEEIIDELKLEQERTGGAPQGGWWLVIRFLRELCGSEQVRLIATLESAREASFDQLRLGEEIGLTPKTINVDANEDTVAEIARSGFSRGGLPLDEAVIDAIKKHWVAFERETPVGDSSPLPLACLLFHRLYEQFSDRARVSAKDRTEGAFQLAGARPDDHVLTLEDIGGEARLAFADVIQTLADEAWLAGGGNPNFKDPIDTDEDFSGLNNFLKPLITVDQDGAIQLRAAITEDADNSTLEKRKAFRERRLLVRVPGAEEERLRLVHQALIDRWSPARRWLACRKQNLQVIQQFRDDAAYWLRRGKPVPLDPDGSTIRAATMTLSEYRLDWTLHRTGELGTDEAGLRDQALAVFDHADDPFTELESSGRKSSYAYLAAAYHRVDLLRRFIATAPDCLHSVDADGDNLLTAAAWSNGPAVPFLIEQGVAVMAETSQWSAITAAIQEKLNDNFDAMIGAVDLDDPIHPATGAKMIHWAARHGNEYAIAQLIKRGAALDATDNRGQTALHFAASTDQASSFCQLWPFIDVQSLNQWDGSAIAQAAVAGSARVILAYLEREHDLERLNAVLLGRAGTGDTPLMLAARYRRPEALKALLQNDLEELGDPRSPAHQSEDGDTLLHRVFRKDPGEVVSEDERFRARTVVEILLRDGRLDPNTPNKRGETPIELGDDWPEARRVLRQDPRVPQDYATMTAAMRIQDLASRSPITVLRLLEEAPQALTDVHQREAEKPASGTQQTAPGETGLDILVRLKNYKVLAALAHSEAHWPTLRQEFAKLIAVAEIPVAIELRAALCDRWVRGEITPSDAGDLFSACLDADDFETARRLVDLGAPPKLRVDSDGFTSLHRAAMLGDADRFRTLLAMCPHAPQPDTWGRLPSDLAPDTKAETFRQMEAAAGAPVAGASPAAASPAQVAALPYLCLEREDDARAPDDELMEELRHAWDAQWGDIAAFEVRVFDLPFHTAVALVEVRPNASNPRSGRLCFLQQDENLLRLNGTSPAIHQVNESARPRITAQTVLPYLAYFCFFVRGEHGPFLNIDRPKGAFLPDLGDQLEDIFRAPRVWGQDEVGRWRVSSLIYYGDAVFFANFLVHATGMIEMINDAPVAEDLPVRVSAPLDFRTLQ